MMHTVKKNMLFAVALTVSSIVWYNFFKHGHTDAIDTQTVHQIVQEQVQQQVQQQVQEQVETLKREMIAPVNEPNK